MRQALLLGLICSFAAMAADDGAVGDLSRKCAELLAGVVPGHKIEGYIYQPRDHFKVDYQEVLRELALEDGTAPPIGSASEIAYTFGSKGNRGKVVLGIVATGGPATERPAERKDLRDGVRQVFTVPAARLALYAADPDLLREDARILTAAMTHPMKAFGKLEAKAFFAALDAVIEYAERYRNASEKRFLFRPVRGISEVLIRIANSGVIVVDRVDDRLRVTLPKVSEEDSLIDAPNIDRLKEFLRRKLFTDEPLPDSWKAPYRTLHRPPRGFFDGSDIYKDTFAVSIGAFEKSVSPWFYLQQLTTAMKAIHVGHKRYALYSLMDHGAIHLAVEPEGETSFAKIAERSRDEFAILTTAEAQSLARDFGTYDETGIQSAFRLWDVFAAKYRFFENARERLAAELSIAMLERGWSFDVVRKRVLSQQRLENGLERWLNVAEGIVDQLQTSANLDVDALFRLWSPEGAYTNPGATDVDSFREKLRAPETVSWLLPLLPPDTMRSFVSWLHSVPKERVTRMIEFYARLYRDKLPEAFNDFVLYGFTRDAAERQLRYFRRN